MKKFIIAFSIVFAGLGASIYSMQQQPPQEYTFELKDGEINLSPQQMQDLLLISVTLKDMLTDPQGTVAMPTASVGLGEVPQFDFQFIIKNLTSIKNKDKLRLNETLFSLQENQLASIINTANFLDIPFLLELGTKIYAKKFVFNGSATKKDFGLDQTDPKLGEQAFKHYVETLSFSSEISNQIAQESNLQNRFHRKISYTTIEEPKKKSRESDSFSIYSLSWQGNQLARQGTIRTSTPQTGLIEKGELVVFDTVTKKPLSTTIQQGYLVKFSPDHTKVIRGTYGKEIALKVIDLNTQSTIKELKDLSRVEWGPHSTFAMLSTDHKTITLFDETGTLLRTFTFENYITTFSLTENKILIGIKNSIEILDQKTGKLLKKIDISVKKPYTKDPLFSSQKSYARVPTALCINATSSQLAVIVNVLLSQGGKNQQYFVAIFDIETGAVTPLLLPETFGIPTAIAFSPDSTQLAIGFSSGALIIYPLLAYVTKALKELSLVQAQLLFYMEQNSIRNFHQLPEYLWELFNSLPTEIKNLFIQETEISAEEHEEAMDIVKEFEQEESEEPEAKRQKTKESEK